MQDFSSLGNLHPVAQVIIGLPIAFAVAYAIYLGHRARQALPTPPPTPPLPTPNMYFDGPLKELLKIGERVARGLERLPPASEALQEVRDQAAQAIRDTRHQLRGEMQQQIAGLEMDTEKQAEREKEDLQRLEKRLDSFDERLRAEERRRR